MITRNNLFCFVFLISFTLLSGCSKHIEKQNNTAPLLPIADQNEFSYLDNEYVKDALQKYFSAKKAPPYSQYDLYRKDLNGDGVKDALVYIKTPYGHWCSIHGCTFLVLKGHKKGFSIIGEMQSVRPPFHISKLRTNGWQDIGINIYGKREDAKTILLSFNKLEYTTLNEPYTLHKPLIDRIVFP